MYLDQRHKINMSGGREEKVPTKTPHRTNSYCTKIEAALFPFSLPIAPSLEDIRALSERRDKEEENRDKSKR